MKKNIRISLIALIFTLVSVSASLAHNLTVLAYVDDQTVYTETYFFDGRAVPNGHVHVMDSHNKVILKGRTNEDGLFSFSPPVCDDLTIVVTEMMGHRNIYKISKDQLVF